MLVAVGEAQATVSPQPSVPTSDEIRQLAYEKWEAAGKPPGDGSDFWLQAEKELLDRNVVGGSPVRTRRSHTVAPSGSRIPPDAVQHSRGDRDMMVVMLQSWPGCTVPADAEIGA
jgi:hypothetical protein